MNGQGHRYHSPRSALAPETQANVVSAQKPMDGEALVNAYHANPTSVTKDQAVRAFLPLVKHIVNKVYLPASSGLQKDDLYHSGVLGLLEALDRFDPTQQTSFKTFAFRRIQGEVIDVIRKTGVLTRSQTKQVKIMLETLETLRNELGREPSHTEVRERMGINAHDYDAIRMLMWQQQPISLDDEVFKDDSETIMRKELLVDEDQLSPEEEFIAMGLKEELKVLIANLPERNRLILALYYYEELTLVDIGRVLGVSESRVSQLLKETLGDLKQDLAPIQ